MKKLLVVLFLLGLCIPAESKVMYGNCVEFNDDFYGHGYGLVTAKNDNGTYAVWIDVFSPVLNLPESQLTVVDDKLCLESK